MIKVLIMLQI